MIRVDVRLRNTSKLIFYSYVEDNQYIVKDSFQGKIHLQHLNNSKTLNSNSMPINMIEIKKITNH